MGGIRRGLALALALAVCAGPARAGNGIQNISVRRQSNLTSVAVSAIVSGDDDSSAVLRIFQKWQGAANYDTGMVMIRRVGTRIHEGRILWMTPGRNVLFYVQGRDAGGDFTTPIMVTSTQPIRGMPGGGPVFFVDQRVGDDRLDGRSKSPSSGLHGPTATIGAALQRLKAAPDQGAGGGIWVARGEYHERLVLDFGDDGAPRFIAGDGRSRDSTIICGANPFAEQGFSGPGMPIEWVALGDSIWATKYPHLWPGCSPGDSVQNVVLGWGEYLHRKTSFKALLQDSTWTGSIQSANTGERSGWLWQHDTLFVKRANGKSPVGLTLHAGYLDDLIDVQRRNWRISDMTLRFAGGTCGDPGHPANPDPGMRGRGIITGINGTGSGLVVVNCRFYGLNAEAICAVQSWQGYHADSVTVAGCIVDGLTVGGMAYAAGKNRVEEHIGQIRLLSSAAIVVDNVITGGFNGMQIGCGDEAIGWRDSTTGSRCEISHNSISHTADDAIELDDSHCINTLLLGNEILDTGHGISQVPIFTGPVFALYNTIADTKSGGIKLGGGSTGIVWYVHNTLTASNYSGWAIDGSSGGSVDNIHFRNNVITAHGKYWGYTIWGTSESSTTTNDFNYDLIDSVTTLRLVYWSGQEYSLPQLQTRLGWEKNGISAAPSFSDSAKQNWTLTPTSPAHGRGQRMTGINTSLDGPLYQGGAPDIGAKTLSALADAPQTGVLPPRFLARAAPNPVRGEGAIVYELPVAAEVTVRLYDPAGRVAATLVNGVKQPAGVHHVSVRDAGLRPGLYFFRVHAGDQLAEGRVVILD